MQPGDTLAPGVRLASVTHAPDAKALLHDALHIDLGEAKLIVTHRTEDRAYAHSARFSMRIVCDAPLTAPQQQGVDRVCACIQANDPATDGPLWQPLRPPAAACVLWLVPGHIGNPLDISIRAARILQGADRLFVEVGSDAAVANIYRALMLGPVPPITALPAPASVLEADLRRGIAQRQRLVLFGADEGVPTLSDPGAQLFSAIATLEASLQVRSTSAGSALSTAQMRAPGSSGGLRFWGLLQPEQGGYPMLRALRWWGWSPLTHIAFADGRQLRNAWPRLRALRWTGTLSLLKELTRSEERCWEAPLGTLPALPPPGFGEDEVLVVTVDTKLPAWLS